MSHTRRSSLPRSLPSNTTPGRRSGLIALAAACALCAACDSQTASPPDASLSADVLDTSTDAHSEPDAPNADASDDTSSDASADVESDTTPSPPELPPRPWPVTERGPYNVGHRINYVTYTPRDETDEEARTMRVSVWYPTHDETGTAARYYAGMRRDGVLASPGVAGDDPMPVLVFSHGNSSFAEQSYFMTEFFATHGWLVVAPDHVGNTFRDTGGGLDLHTAVYRPQDISAVLDWLGALPADDPLHGRASADIALSGHSFGGFTTLATAGAGFAVDELLEACERGEVGNRYCTVFGVDHHEVFRAGLLDTRIRVAIPQTPGGFLVFGERLADIAIPTLLWTAARDRTLPNDEEGDPIWEAMAGEHHMRIDLTDGGHFTFSNMCELLSFVPQVRDDGCGEDFIDPFEGFDLINAYSLAFARYHLFGDETDRALLDGTVRLTDAMTISWK